LRSFRSFEKISAVLLESFSGVFRNIFFEVLNELELFIDKTVIFDKNKQISVGPPHRPLSANFVIRINFFPLQVVFKADWLI
jgi:hypothetical protein